MGSLPALTDREKADILLKLPDWMDAVPGFRFIWDNSMVIVIGWGGWREIDVFGSIRLVAKGKDTTHGCPDAPDVQVKVSEILGAFKMKPATLLGAYSHKGEWFMCSIPDLEDMRASAFTLSTYENLRGKPHPLA